MDSFWTRIIGQDCKFTYLDGTEVIATLRGIDGGVAIATDEHLSYIFPLAALKRISFDPTVDPLKTYQNSQS